MRGNGVTGVAAKGGLVGVTYHRVCLCVSTSPDLRERSRVHTRVCVCVCMHLRGCARVLFLALSLSPSFAGGGRADRGTAGARGQIRGMVV